MKIRTLLQVACGLALAGSACDGGGGAPGDTPSLDQAPPGARIVFVSSRSGEGDIYALDPETAEISLVVGTPDPEGVPRHDPSRRRIVHTRFMDDGTRAVLYACDDALFDDPTGEAGPAWSPDGSAVAYAMTRDGRQDLFVAAADGSNERRVTDDAIPDRYAAWSPDGRSLAISRQLDDGWALFVADLEAGGGTTPRQVTPAVAYLGHPAWSPDGARVAFDFDAGGQTDIGVVDLPAGEVIRLTRRPGNDLVPAWSPDGTTLAFAGDSDDPGGWDVWTVDIRSGELARLTSEPGFDGAPVYVPAATATACANPAGAPESIRR